MSRIILPGQEEQENNPLGQFMQQINVLGHMFKQLEHAIINMSQEMQAQALMAQMLGDILVEKGIVTREEYGDHIAVKVMEPMKKSTEELKKRIEEAQKMQQQVVDQMKEQEEPVAEEQTAKETVEEDDSDVVLPSERNNNVVRFPNVPKEEK